MSLPAGFARTADAPAPLPLHVVDRGGFAAWRDAQPPAVQAWLADELQRHPRLVVLGDFNIAPDDRDVHDPLVWNDDHILTSTPERDALRGLLGLGLQQRNLRHAGGAAPGHADQQTGGDQHRGTGQRTRMEGKADAVGTMGGRMGPPGTRIVYDGLKAHRYRCLIRSPSRAVPASRNLPCRLP